jgi:hypothetical protein
MKHLALTLAFAVSVLPFDLYVREAGNVARPMGLVSTGVPFAQGQATSLSGMSVVHNGTPLAAQFKPLSLYPDNSVRWALVTFSDSINAGEVKTYQVGPGSNPASGTLVTEDAAKITVNTGTVTFEILKGSAFNGINKVTVGGQVVAQAAAGDGVILKTGGTIKTGIPDSMRVHETGPVRAAVSVYGTFSGEADISQGKYGRRQFMIHFYAYKGSNRIQITAALHNNGNRLYSYELSEGFLSENANIRLDEFAFKLNLGLGAARTVRSEHCTTTVSSGDTYALFSGFNTNSAHKLKARSFTKHMKNGSPVIPDITATAANLAAAPFRDPGWLDVTDNSHGVTVTHHTFWQRFPKSVELRGSQLVMGILPENTYGSTKWFGEPWWTAMTNDYVFYAGEITSHRFELAFYAGSNGQGAELSKMTQYPLAGRPSSKYTEGTGALWSFIAGTAEDAMNWSTGWMEGAVEQVERYPMACVDTNWIRADEDRALNFAYPTYTLDEYRDNDVSSNVWHPAMYGFRNYGPMQSSINSGTLSQCHYDWPRSMLRAWLKTGNYKNFYEGDIECQYKRDYGTYHYTWGVHARPANSRSYMYGHPYHEYHNNYTNPSNTATMGVQGSHGAAGAPSGTHDWKEGQLLHYFLTGDYQDKWVMDEYVHAQINKEIYNLGSIARWAPYYGGAELRANGWPMVNCCVLWEYAAGSQRDSLLLLACEEFENSFYKRMKEGDTNTDSLYNTGPATLMYGYGSQAPLRIGTLLRKYYPSHATLPKVDEWMQYLTEIIDKRDWKNFRTPAPPDSQEVHGVKCYRMPGYSYSVDQVQDSYATDSAAFEDCKNSVWTTFFADVFAYVYTATSQQQYLDVARRYFRTSAYTWCRGSWGFDIPTWVPAGYVNENYRCPARFKTIIFSGTETKPGGWFMYFNNFFLSMEKSVSGSQSRVAAALHGAADAMRLSARPNPFNPATKIACYIPRSTYDVKTPVKLAIYDVGGRLIRSWIKNADRTQHEFTWDAGNLPSGLYLVKLAMGQKTLIRKITLIK